MPLPPYTPDADDATKPTDFVSGGYAAREIRALKVKINALQDGVITDLAIEVSSLRTLSGTAAGENDLGTGFNYIPDNSDIATAITDLDGELFDLATDTDGNISDLQTALGSSTDNMGTYTGSIVSDNESAKDNIQELETAIENFANNIFPIQGSDIDTDTVAESNLTPAVQTKLNSGINQGNVNRIYVGNVNSTASNNGLPAGWSATRLSDGVYRVTHNLGIRARHVSVSGTTVGGGQGSYQGYVLNAGQNNLNDFRITIWFTNPFSTEDENWNFAAFF